MIFLLLLVYVVGWFVVSSHSVGLSLMHIKSDDL